MIHRRTALAGRISASLGAVAGVTALYVLVMPVNPATVALTYLVFVLALATWWGIAESTVASIAAMVCFNFFFLPPIGTLTIADPQNWVALVAFLMTAIIASQLSGRARQRNIEALARQGELERLYVLSRAILLSEGGSSLPGNIARHITVTFGLKAAGVYDERRDVIAWAGSALPQGSDETLRAVARRGTIARDADHLIVLPIQLGGVPIGSVAITDVGLSDTVVNSIANLAAIGLERARVEEATARAEAARHSSELRAAILDALAHEFKTPLTSMKAASSDLAASPTAQPRDRELAAIIDEEVDRFQARLSDAVYMLRIDAGNFAVHRERLDLRELLQAVLAHFESHLDGRTITLKAPNGVTADADRQLLSLAVRQLVDNAIKYSAPNSTIDLVACHAGSEGVTISVVNSGSTIDEHERAHIFDRFYRGANSRNVPGTGMGLAIVRQVLQAHAGSVSVDSSPREGTSFTMTLPDGGVQR